MDGWAAAGRPRKAFFTILGASGRRDVHFVIVKCHTTKNDVFYIFLHRRNIAKTKLSCRREIDFAFSLLENMFFFKSLKSRSRRLVQATARYLVICIGNYKN